MSVGDWLFKRALISLDKPTIVSNEQVLTYSRMNKWVNRLPRAMQSMGLIKSDRAGVVSRNCTEILEIYLACAKMGIVFVPLNFRLAPPELA